MLFRSKSQLAKKDEFIAKIESEYNQSKQEMHEKMEKLKEQISSTTIGILLLST